MSEEEHEKLIQLIRKVAWNLFYELMDEHLDDYEHKEKPVDNLDTE